MTDSEVEAIREKCALVRLQEQIGQMLLSSDVYSIIKELDYKCKYSSEVKMATIQTLMKVRKRHPDKAAKVQRLIDHYGKERKDIVVLKPGKS
jgi:hypothetical protein